MAGALADADLGRQRLMLTAEPLRHRQRLVAGVGHSEDDLEVAMALLREGAQILREAGVDAAQRFQDADLVVARLASGPMAHHAPHQSSGYGADGEPER